MKITNFKGLALAALLSAALFSCKKDTEQVVIIDPIETPGKYQNGFFIINEGWFGHGTGSVSFYDAANGTLKDSVFQKENDGKGFEPTSSTVQYGTVFNKNLYIISKAKGPVVVTDAKTMKEVGRIPASSEYDWRAFVGIDENNGLLSSSDGIYLVNLKTLKPTFKLIGTKGQIGDMLKTDKYIYTLSQSEGAVIYNVSDLSVQKKIAGVTMGFARTPDGKVWYTIGKNLYKSDPATLETEAIELPFSTFGTFGAWFSSPIIASTKENSVFMIKMPNSWGGGQDIYKYVSGDKTSLDKPFITATDKQVFYKKNLGYYAQGDQIVTTTMLPGFGANSAVNFLNIYDAKTGTLSKTVPFSGYYFPSMFAFH
ncbi:DUF5074 domain-containing protein [Pedobacter gandavensis]|uniref:DUF5074 domain-containing protein n=1 Tax=Pedobacter gandavensis TaxID=2679963 RepID=UPI00292F5CBA|nr:DUF5074 domain-containing protein [Pedobacter gandavensis]